MNEKIQLGKYEHYKGKQYEVVGIAKHSETMEELVVYRALYGEHDLWVRPLKMFSETVEIEGKKIPRFRFIESQKEFAAKPRTRCFVLVRGREKLDPFDSAQGQW